MNFKIKKPSYDINDPYDIDMIIDNPALLNKKGRKVMKKRKGWWEI